MAANTTRTFNVSVNHRLRFWCVGHQVECIGIPKVVAQDPEAPISETVWMLDGSDVECPTGEAYMDYDNCGEWYAVVEAEWLANPPIDG